MYVVHTTCTISWSKELTYKPSKWSISVSRGWNLKHNFVNHGFIDSERLTETTSRLSCMTEILGSVLWRYPPPPSHHHVYIYQSGCGRRRVRSIQPVVWKDTPPPNSIPTTAAPIPTQLHNSRDSHNKAADQQYVVPNSNQLRADPQAGSNVGPRRQLRLGKVSCQLYLKSSDPTTILWDMTAA